MDLIGVKCILKDGYERINKMKTSMASIESYRSRLKVKGQSIMQEVNSMMTEVTDKLFQLHMSIEATVRETLVDREIQLDTKKKEVQDCYVKLAEICVEADNILRGRNTDTLGRSCQHLLSKYEATNVQLDAAEKTDMEDLISFEFQNNSEQFLSNTFVARLQHFDRHQKLAEVDEFWVDYKDSDQSANQENKTAMLVSTPNHFENLKCMPAMVRRSPENNSSNALRSSLIAAQGVSKDTSLSKDKFTSWKNAQRPGVEIVRISEMDLCVQNCLSENNGIDKGILEQNLCTVSPPPGFSSLQKSVLDSPHLTPKQRFNGNQSPWADCPQVGTSGQDSNCQRFDSTSKLDRNTNSESEAACADRTSSIANSSPCASQNFSQFTKTNGSVRTKTTDTQKSRDEEDFIWDSDDSVDFPKMEAKVNAEGSGQTEAVKSKGFDVPRATEKLETPVNANNVALKSVCPQQNPVTPVSSSECSNEITQSDTGSCVSTPPCQLTDRLVYLTKEKLANIKVEKEPFSEPIQDELQCTQHVSNVAKGGTEQISEPLQEELRCAQHVSNAGKEGIKQMNKQNEPDFEPEVRGNPVKMEPGLEPLITSNGKNTEISRPIKIRSKHLDLNVMLVFSGGSMYGEINAKCVEKIRGDFDHPIGVCTNSRGDVIVADTGNNIVKMCNNGRVINKLGADLKMRRPSAVVVNEKDEIFVKDDCCLYHFDAEGQFIKTMGKKLMNAPYGLGLTKDGALVVVDVLYSNARLHIFQQNGAFDTYPYQPLRIRHDDSKCRFLAVHGGEILTSDLGRSCLYLTNLHGELKKVIGQRGKRSGELCEPAGVAVDSVGNWVVADSKNHRVQVFAQNGYFMAAVRFSGESIRRPSGIHLTKDGFLYVINYLDSVIKVFKLGTS